MHYVIIGNSTAAIGCVEGIRQADSQGRVTLIADEPWHTYSRPLISYLLQGKVDEERMKYRPDDFYRQNDCAVMLGRVAEAIDVAAKKVRLRGGQTVSYDKLLVATGSRPFTPPMEGLDSVPAKFSFMSLADAQALDAALAPGDKRVFIVGAGLIGLKCAEGLSGRVKSLTVADLAPRILPSILDEEGSAMVREHIAARGVDFHLGQSVARFAGNKATLTGGAEVEFDLLVLAVGVRPNTELVREAGGQVGRGIVVSARGETSLPDVYSAGDCVESWDITTGESRVLAVLPNAYRQGECAGLNMAGADKEITDAFPLNAIGFFGLHMVTAGSYAGEEYTRRSGGDYKRLVYEDDRLKGFILIGSIERAGIYTALIRKQTPLSSIDFELIKEKPQLMAFSRQERARQLGGRV
ncbi:MAG: FAD-dependent oxidoreductase [Gracilibacteraceae bacterium]|jgi:NAD(P)H-nitrite reductase large subunit|nr:FAD-dependent oxidoreductase [Gracilibacteraceae bacterium]